MIRLIFSRRSNRSLLERSASMISRIMIFATREQPQYIVVPLSNSKIKDMFTYLNKFKTIKIAVQTSNLEK